LEAFEERSGPAAARVVRDLRLSSAACVPLSIGRRAVGTLTLARSLPDTAFDQDDVALLTVIAERVATSLENARLYEQQRVIADTLQNVLMPRFLPTVRSLDIAGRYRPLTLVGHVGGDFYDVLSLGDDRCAIMVGDIAGKGITAAAAVGLARHTLRATVSLDSSPTTVIRQVNDALLEEDRMCTLAYVLLERGDGGWQMGVTLAGHPPPIVVRANGEVLSVGRPCPPVGVLPHLEPIEVEVHLEPGDMAIMYTDGFSLPGLTPPESIELALSKCTGGTADTLLDEMLDVLFEGPDQGRDPADDVALLALKVSST
ncbi:MAG: PP2C family protein-serine/threonine phosphatase, partial [Acidimicrobiia bacterium]